MNDLKKKKSLNKVWAIKQITFADEHSRSFYRKIEVSISVDSLKSCNATLTSIKDSNLQAETCFTCHKSDHTSRECSDQLSRVNALDNEDEFDHSVSESDFDSKN